MSDVTTLIIPFGKHAGETIEEVYVEDKQYLEWLLDNIEDDRYDGFRSKLEEACIILHRRLRL